MMSPFGWRGRRIRPP